MLVMINIFYTNKSMTVPKKYRVICYNNSINRGYQPYLIEYVDDNLLASSFLIINTANSRTINFKSYR